MGVKCGAAEAGAGQGRRLWGSDRSGNQPEISSLYNHVNSGRIPEISWDCFAARVGSPLLRMPCKALAVVQGAAARMLLSHTG